MAYPLGLVLEGGAHRTVFSVGVMDALLDSGVYADYVIGASAGITYGASYISKQKGRNREMLRRFVRSPKYMGVRHLLDPFNRSYYNMKYVYETIPNTLLPFDYDTYNASPTRKVAVLTDMRAGQAVYQDVPGDDPSWKVLQATCALPLMFKPVKLDGVLYADGGVTDPIPFQHALDDGCQKLIIVLTQIRSYRKGIEKMMGTAVRHVKGRYPAFAEQLETRHERYNDCIEEIAALEAEGRVFVIAPEDTLGVSRTEKDLDKLMALYAQGYAIAAQSMPSLKAYLRA